MPACRASLTLVSGWFGPPQQAGVAVEVVPGPSAALAALVASGLPAARFCFEGFLPRKGRERRGRLGEIAARDCTTVLYEAPHRVPRTVDRAGLGVRPGAGVRGRDAS